MKKSIFTMVLSLFLIFLTMEVNAQQNFTVVFKMPPPGTLNLNDLYNITVTNNSGSDQSGYLVGTAKEDKDGMIAKGTTVPIMFKKGINNIKIKDLPKTPDVEYIASDPRYKESLIRQGMFPSGNYEICVKVMSAAINEELGSDCINQEVLEKGLLSLINPVNEEVIDSKIPITFSWSSGGKVQEGGYTLKICEVMENQTPETAMKGNKAWFEQKGINSTTIAYPNSAKGFEDGTTYAWMLSSGKTESEVYTFIISNEEQIINTDGSRSTCTCSFTSAPVIPSILNCANAVFGANHIVGYQITLPGFVPAISPCITTLQYQIDGGSWVNAPASGIINTLPMMTPAPAIHTITFQLRCNDGGVITFVPSPYPANSFTVNAATNVVANICDNPVGDINRGCVKTFNIVDQLSTTCPDNPSISFPTACNTRYDYLICKAPTTGGPPARPSPSDISVSLLYPDGPGNCSPTLTPNIWYRIRNNPLPYGPNNTTVRSAPVPQSLKESILGESYYVICYISNPCCFLPDYATNTTVFRILPPAPTLPAIISYVCSPSTYPQTDYNQCCEKKFELKSNSSCSGSTFSMSGATYYWIISKSPTGTNSVPSCLSEVTQSYTATNCTGAGLPNPNIWYCFKVTSSATVLAPPLPVLSPGQSYMVSCYVKRSACSNMLPNANFATPQVFKVKAAPTPAPVIAWTDPLATSTISAGITTFTRCTPPAITIPLSVTGLPVGSTTIYEWFDNNNPVGAGSTYMPTTPGTHVVYVYTTTTSPPYIAPGCRVKSNKVNVIINNCPCTQLQCSNASLMGVSVATRINTGGVWPTANRVVGSGIELPSCGPTLGMAGSAGRFDIDFNSNSIRINCLQDATYGGVSFFNFSNIIPPAVLGCPSPVISSITVTTNHPLSPFNVITSATFTQNTVYIYFAPNSGTLNWKQGHYINVQLNYGCP